MSLPFAEGAAEDGVKTGVLLDQLRLLQSALFLVVVLRSAFFGVGGGD